MGRLKVSIGGKLGKYGGAKRKLRIPKAGQRGGEQKGLMSDLRGQAVMQFLHERYILKHQEVIVPIMA
jgi:hypothetical protein